MKNTICG